MAEPSDRASEADPTAYWGYLFHQNKCPTEKLDRLLKGIAACISREILPHDCADLKPAQLAAFYRRVGGQYDPLFLDMPAQSIAYIYKSLGCLHSLQPDPAADDGPYATPSVPALKSVGFVTWQTIQLLLGPEEHVPFVQNALKEFDVRDPVDGTRFPTILPREAFPLKPDQKMVEWHEGVSERLRLEAQKEIEYTANVENHRHNHDRSRSGSAHPTPSNSTLALKHDSDDRAQAASYFSNPFNKNKDGRPGVVRTITKAPQRVMRGGRTVAATAGRTLKNVVDPHLWSGEGYKDHKDHDRDSRERARDRRRKSTGDSDYSSVSPLPDRDLSRRHDTARIHPNRSPEDAPNADHFSRSPREDRKYPIRPMPAGPSPRDVREGRPARRHRSGSPSSSPDAANGRRPRHYAPPSPHAPQPHTRRHRSQDPPASPRDYFDDWQRSRPQQHQAAAGLTRQTAPGSQARARPNSQYGPARHQPPPPQIHRTEPSFDVEDETDSTDSDVDRDGPWEPNAHLSHNSHFAASTSPAMAAKVSHSRGPSGGGLHPEDPYASRPSPAEYRPIDERLGGSRHAPNNSASAGNGQGGQAHHGPRAHFADDLPPSSTTRGADSHPSRPGSTSPISPGTDAPPEKDQYDLSHSRDGSRQRIPRGPGPLLYGEVPPGADFGDAGGNIGVSPVRSSAAGPRRVTPVEGVKGRRYAHEMAWPGGRA